jgi:hypothetical protein
MNMLNYNYLENLPIKIKIESCSFNDIYFKKIKQFELEFNNEETKLKISLLSNSGAREDILININENILIDARKYDLIRFLNNSSETVDITIKVLNPKL